MGFFKGKSTINKSGKSFGELSKSATTATPTSPDPLPEIVVTAEYEEIKNYR
jgi:hypothetical protein